MRPLPSAAAAVHRQRGPVQRRQRLLRPLWRQADVHQRGVLLCQGQLVRDRRGLLVLLQQLPEWAVRLVLVDRAPQTGLVGHLLLLYVDDALRMSLEFVMPCLYRCWTVSLYSVFIIF